MKTILSIGLLLNMTAACYSIYLDRWDQVAAFMALAILTKLYINDEDDNA